jgi:hypothetical protein
VRRAPATILSALLACLASASAALAQAPSAEELRAQYDEVTLGGAWHFKSVPCVDGTVADVHPRLGQPGQHTFSAQDFRSSGVVVSVRLPRPTAFVTGVPLTSAGVTHYQGDFDNDIMAAERRGDRVQVCPMSFPTPTYDKTRHAYRCNPDRDPRGWTFRIYDYRQHAAYYGSQTQHGCGGA